MSCTTNCCYPTSSAFQSCNCGTSATGPYWVVAPVFGFILILVIIFCIFGKNTKNAKTQLSTVVNPSSNISTINPNRQFQNRPEITTINENSKYNDYSLPPPPKYEEMEIKGMPSSIAIQNGLESDVPLPVIPGTINRTEKPNFA